MARLNEFLGSILSWRPGASRAGRALALALAVALLFASVSPAWAVTVEVESEGEGSAPPVAGPAPEGPEFEPEGEETALGEGPPLAGQEAPPVEDQVPPPEAPPLAPEAPEPEVPAGSETQIVPPPPAPEPVYENVEGPSYQAEAAPPPVVHGEAIVAPPSPSAAPGHDERQGGQSLVPLPPEAPPEVAPPAEVPPPAAPPVEAPEPASTPPAEPVEAPGTLAAGRHFHVVRPGESLWSIATALLPAGAGNAQIAAEVHRLWRQNAGRIGTGDPNLLFVGTRLRLV